MGDARAQARMTFFSRVAFSLATFSCRLWSMKGPFLVERLTYFFSRRRMMSLLEAFFGFRVREPRAGLPQGVFGLPPGPVLPSPPPWGWSFGFIVAPRTVGRLPSQRLRPALPPDSFSCSMLPTWPMVALQLTLIRRSSPEGIRTAA